MFIFFLYEESYFKFLINFLECKEKIENESIDSSLNIESKKITIDFCKNTKHLTESDTQKLSKFMLHKELGKELKERTESLSLKKTKKNSEDIKIEEVKSSNFIKYKDEKEKNLKQLTTSQTLGIGSGYYFNIRLIF